MQHLSEESLARLVDEEPGAEEVHHLEHCALCRAELKAVREQTRALAALPDLNVPARLWTALEGRLVAEGLARRHRHPVWGRRPPLVRIAAALALFLAGSATGFVARGEVAGPAVSTGGVDTPTAVRNVAEAGQRLRQAEAAYMAALTRYSELSGAQHADDPLNRLAALEGIVLTTRAALEEAPTDPVINGYHLTALEQRDALLEQISRTPRPADDTREEWY